MSDVKLSFTLSFEETVLITAALRQTAEYLSDSLKQYENLAPEDKSLGHLVLGIRKDINTLLDIRTKFLTQGNPVL